MLNSSFKDLAKISIIGHPAVGKTTILNLLTENKIEKTYIPTQGFDLKTIKGEDNNFNYNFKIWDFGGQKVYLNYLEDYLVGSDLVFIVTDSTALNVLNSKELIKRASNIIEEDCPLIAIANKQDLCKSDGRLDEKLVEDILQIKTYGLTATNPSERLKLLTIIQNELNKTLMRRGKFKKK
ncbi:MAG TPA: ADP-ribosylation factor-like protein [Candidatus Lokiarchaeia archaeon]